MVREPVLRGGERYKYQEFRRVKVKNAYIRGASKFHQERNADNKRALKAVKRI